MYVLLFWIAESIRQLLRSRHHLSLLASFFLRSLELLYEAEKFFIEIENKSLVYVIKLHTF